MDLNPPHIRRFSDAWELTPNGNLTGPDFDAADPSRGARFLNSRIRSLGTAAKSPTFPSRIARK